MTASGSELSVPVRCGSSATVAHVGHLEAAGVFLFMSEPPEVDVLIDVGPAGACVRGVVVSVVSGADAASTGRRAGAGVRFEVPVDPETLLRAWSAGTPAQIGRVALVSRPVIRPAGAAPLPGRQAVERARRQLRAEERAKTSSAADD